MRGQKGITLVALVITIVVLLLLALVAVNSIEETNIINYTKNATSTWNNAVGNEVNDITYFENTLKNAFVDTGLEEKDAD